MTNLTRRDLLARSAGIIILTGDAARAGVISGNLPWQPDAATPPKRVLNPTAWAFFTPPEAAAVEAIADRIIPPDPDTPGGKGAGCAVFIDRQLAGPYGSSEDLYNSPPFAPGAPNQGAQSAITPGGVYREGLAALEEYARSQGAAAFTELSPEKHDEILKGLENGTLQLRGADGKVLFETLLKDVQSGFFADPIYGGNRDMCAWKMIGFPGARYDYRDWVGRHNERVPFAPVSELFLRPQQTTFTFRNKMDQTALPIRTWGAFMPPNGVGGGGVHWNAETWRFLPSDFTLRTHLTQRYGARFLPSEMDFHDNEIKQNAFLTDRFAEIFQAMGAQQIKKYTARRLTTLPITRQRIYVGARSREPIRRAAPSIAICRAGMCRTSSSWARADFRRTRDTIPPVPWQLWRTHPLRPFAPVTLRIQGRWCMREPWACGAGRVGSGSCSRSRRAIEGTLSQAQNCRHAV